MEPAWARVSWGRRLKSKIKMDSRFRGNDGAEGSGHSGFHRLRLYRKAARATKHGNPQAGVIPATAGIHAAPDARHRSHAPKCRMRTVLVMWSMKVEPSLP